MFSTLSSRESFDVPLREINRRVLNCSLAEPELGKNEERSVLYRCYNSLETDAACFGEKHFFVSHV